MTTSTSKRCDGITVPATFTRHDDRGLFVEAINAGPWETVITGTMRARAVLGNHYHKRTRLFFFVLSGCASADVVDVATGERRSCGIEAQHGLHLEPDEAHAIRFLKDSTFVLLKSRAYSDADPDTYAYSVLDTREQ